MQEGIGRGGYRVLAIVFYVVGALALAGTVYAFMRPQPDVFNYAMSVLSVVAMTTLFVLLLVLLRRVDKAAPDAKPAATSFMPNPIAPATPQRDIQFDFEVEDDGSLEADETPAPIRPFGRDLPEVPAKREVRLPPNRNLDADTKGWPKRKGPTGVTRGEMKKLQIERVTQPKIDIEGDVGEALVLPMQPKRLVARLPGDTPRPTAKPNMAISRSDVIEARMAFPNTTVPKGMARGKCGSCNANLYAPTQRPIHLRCPTCGKVTSLT